MTTGKVMFCDGCGEINRGDPTSSFSAPDDEIRAWVEDKGWNCGSVGDYCGDCWPEHLRCEATVAGRRCKRLQDADYYDGWCWQHFPQSREKLEPRVAHEIAWKAVFGEEEEPEPDPRYVSHQKETEAMQRHMEAER